MEHVQKQHSISSDLAAHRSKVMVVDDDVHVRDGLRLLLESEGYDVVDCSGGSQALRLLREIAPPDVILLDLHMPQMNGWEFRVEQKKDPRWASIPLIALSADRSAEAEAIDAAAYLRKPVDDAVLLETVKRFGHDVAQTRTLARASEVERLVSLGSLIGGIAHEINNPLASVDGGLELLRRRLVELTERDGDGTAFAANSAFRALERAKLGVDRIAAVVQCVSLFANADSSSVELLDVHQVIESSLQVASNELRHCATLERDYKATRLVLGSPAKLGQVLLNLLLNAVFAIRESDEQDHTIRVCTSNEAGSVVISVADSASDPKAQLTKDLFDPLATIAPGSMGLRFGLAISREVVEAMGGSIEVRPGSPRGTTFRVVLPSRAEAVTPVPNEELPVRLEPQRASLVVIDDDPLMCEVLAALLGDDYVVLAFTSPRAALASILQGKFDLVLCDVMMPELNGIDLYERLIRDRPDMADRFVFITGGAFTERARLFLKETDIPTVNKPFGRHALFNVIRATLATAQAEGKRLSEN